MGAFRAALLILAATAGSSGAAAEVRDAETAFARAFALQDSAKFFTFVAEDATFLSPEKTLGGKAQIEKGWTPFFQQASPPFSWRPERVVVNASGTIGLSTGPVVDAAGRHVGDYSSVWQKQKDGGWKVIFDGPGAPVCPPGEKK